MERQKDRWRHYYSFSGRGWEEQGGSTKCICGPYFERFDKIARGKYGSEEDENKRNVLLRFILSSISFFQNQSMSVYCCVGPVNEGIHENIEMNMTTEGQILWECIKNGICSILNLSINIYKNQIEY